MRVTDPCGFCSDIG